MRVEALRIGPSFRYVIVGLAFALFGLFSLAHIGQPVAQDDLFYLVAARTLHETGAPQKFGSADRFAAYSPELYLQLLAWVFTVLGANEATARLPGIVAGALSIGLVFLIIASLCQGTRVERLQWAAVTCLLYAVTPGVVQGALILAIDNTILMPAVLLLCWLFVKYLQEQRICWAALAGGAMAVSLWGRVTTPTILGAVLSGVAVTVPGPLRRKLVPVGALLTGAGLFLVSWYLYCVSLDIPFAGPFLYAAGSFREKVEGLTVSQLLQNVLHFTLWVGVFPALWLLVLLARRGRALFYDRKLSPEDVFLLAGLSLALGYLVIGGAIFGFPKYQMPAVPLLYVFGAVALSKSTSEPLTLHGHQVLLMLCSVLAACAVQVFIAGDWIYLVRFQVREALAFGRSDSTGLFREIALRVGLCAIAYGLLAVSLLRWTCRSAAGVLFALSMGSNLGIVLLQSAGDYHTGYNYGGRGTVEAARYIRDRVPADSVVIAPNEVTYYLQMPNSPYWPNFIWANVEELRRRLEDPKSSALAYSIATNTIPQIRAVVESMALQAILRREYEQSTVGSYTVWIRRPAARHAGSLADEAARSVLVRLWVLTSIPMIETDGERYVMLARRFQESGLLFDPLFHPLYPLCIAFLRPVANPQGART